MDTIAALRPPRAAGYGACTTLAARIRCFAVLGLLLGTFASAAIADDAYELERESPLRLRGLLDTRVVHGGRALAWTDRGPGKTRYGGNPSGDGPGRDTRLVLSQLALAIGG